MITHFDLYNGAAASDLTSRKPTIGGPITAAAGTTLGSIVYVTAGGAFAQNNAQGTYAYAAKLANPDFTITWEIAYDPADNGTNVGIIVAPTSAFATYVEVSWNQVTQLLKLDIAGTVTSFTTTFAAAATHLFELRALTFSTGNRQLDLYVDGVSVLSGNYNGTADLFLWLRMHGPTAGGAGSSTIKSLVAADLATAPTTPVSFLNSQLGVFAQYTPPTATTLSACRFEYPARAIILKGPMADVAAQWLLENTAGELIFAP